MYCMYLPISLIVGSVYFVINGKSSAGHIMPFRTTSTFYKCNTYFVANDMAYVVEGMRLWLLCECLLVQCLPMLFLLSYIKMLFMYFF